MNHISIGVDAIQCYKCGTYVEEKPILLGAKSRDDVNYEDEEEIPTCNDFNASLPIYWMTCPPEEKGCLKGWLTQVNT